MKKIIRGYLMSFLVLGFLAQGIYAIWLAFQYPLTKGIYLSPYICGIPAGLFVIVTSVFFAWGLGDDLDRASKGEQKV